jgi:quercetin dioxygenase-like cupin family protein
MEITPKRPTTKGPAETFTGDVWIDPIVKGVAPSHVRVNIVRFSPGARSAWHSHALGQTLYVTDGVGLVRSRGEAIVELFPGHVVHAEGGEEHWHGAAPDTFMVHLSITEATDDAAVPETTWGAHVTEDEYQGR